MMSFNKIALLLFLSPAMIFASEPASKSQFQNNFQKWGFPVGQMAFGGLLLKAAYSSNKAASGLVGMSKKMLPSKSAQSLGNAGARTIFSAVPAFGSLGFRGFALASGLFGGYQIYRGYNKLPKN